MKRPVLSFLFTSLFALSYAQDLNLHELYPYIGMEKMDSLVLQHVYDSSFSDKTEEDGSLLFEGEVYYAPDSIFRMYHFEGERCLAYCSPFHILFWAYTDLKSGEVEFLNIEEFEGSVDRIVKMDQDQYLIMAQRSGRPRSIERTSCHQVALVTFDQEPCFVWDFEVCTSSLIDKGEWICEVDFDPKSKDLTYKYQWYDESADFRTYTVSGIWEYQEGKYVNVKEEKVYLK